VHEVVRSRKARRISVHVCTARQTREVSQAVGGCKQSPILGKEQRVAKCPAMEEAEPPVHAQAATADSVQRGAKADHLGVAGGATPPACDAVEKGGLLELWGRKDGPFPLDDTLCNLIVETPPPPRTGGAYSVDEAPFALLSGSSLLSKIPSEEKKTLVSRLVRECPRSSVAKAVGSMVALAAADATGHWFEFMDVCDRPGANVGRSLFDVSKLQVVPATASDPRANPPACFTGQFLNRFALHMGQWTDDCSMSLCMADSLLVKQCYDGSDIRVRFWSWWNKGYCNAFGKEAAQGRPRSSVGLGGNISKSIFSMREQETPTPTFESSGEDSGNGSLMRLAPVAIYYSGNERDCMDFARQSSYTTHPGKIAAECCALQAFLIARAIQDPRLPIVASPGSVVSTVAAEATEELTAESWLVQQVTEYLEQELKDRDGVGVDEVRRMLISSEPEGSLERNWNWRASEEEGLQIEKTLQLRGHSYNGHPVSAGYFGSYAVDGLALALHCVATTKSLDAAIERCLNFLGDADTTGAIVGQIAGAIYGIAGLNPAFVENLQQWDDGDVAARAYMLHFEGQRSTLVHQMDALQADSATLEQGQAY